MLPRKLIKVEAYTLFTSLKVVTASDSKIGIFTGQIAVPLICISSETQAELKGFRVSFRNNL